VIPINVDRNVGPGAYESRLSFGELLVTGIFYTVQGEGPLGGQPAVFLRLAGCNLGAKEDCPWCDTRFNFDEGARMSPQEVMRTIDKVAIGRTSLVVVTGGEPLLQWRSLVGLMDSTRGQAYQWQFETNGYYLKQDVVDSVRKMSLLGHPPSFVVSPKIPHGTGLYREIPAYWRTLLLSLKYVVEADIASPYHVIGPVPEWARFVFVSGMTAYRRPLHKREVANFWDDTLIDRERTGMNYRHAAWLVATRGRPLRLSYQTHLLGALE
jgi:hypothetical protein